MKFFCIAYTLLLAYALPAQELYLFGTNHLDPYDWNKLNIEDCSLEKRCAGIPGLGNFEDLHGYVYSPTGKIYTINRLNNRIYEYNEDMCTLVYVDTILTPLSMVLVTGTGMTVDEQGVLYIGGQKVVRYNPFTGEQKVVFKFDDALIDYPYLFMHNNTLAAVDADRNILLLDTVQNQIDTIAKQIPNAVPGFSYYSVATETIPHCDSVPSLLMEAYIFDWSTFDFFPNLVRVKEDYSVDVLCFFPPSSTYGMSFICSATSTRNACNTQIDLDIDDSSMGVGGSFIHRIDCPGTNISSPICDTDIVSDINILPHLDSVIVVLRSGVTAPGQEFLELNSGISPDIAVSGIGTETITLRRLPLGTMSEMEAAIREVRYRHTGTTVQAGERLIDIIPYRFHLSGKKTTAHIILGASTVPDTFMVTLCSGNSFAVNGNTYVSSGIYTDTLTNSIGCDSIIYTYLTVLPATTSDTVVSVCAGSGFHIGNNTYYLSGTYMDTLTTPDGCDSIIYTYLTVLPANERVDYQVLCFGGQWNVGGNQYSISGIYIDVLTGQNNCDSIITTHLTVLPLQTSVMNRQICTGDSLLWNNQYYTHSGTYSDTLITSSGCDSFCTLILSTIPPVNQQVDTVLCSGTYIDVLGQRLEQAGTYVFTRQNMDTGCIDTLTYRLEMDDLSVMPIPEIHLFRGGSASIILDIQSDALIEKIRWIPSDGLNCDTCRQVIITPLASLTYQILVENETGCTTEQSVEVLVRESGNIYFPNILSYSDDNTENRLFRIYSEDTEITADCIIMDRWGGLVFQQNNIQPNTWPGWDGTWKGEKLNPGVYMYSIRIRRTAQTDFEEFNGTITIVD